MAEKSKPTSPTEQPSTPAWLDVALIQKALRNDGEQSQVTGLSVSAAIAPGENYTSTLYRVKAALPGGEERSVLVKALPSGEPMRGFVEKAGIFRRESGMLEDVIPKMQALLEEAAPGRFPPLAARHLLYGRDPEEFIVMEDLSPSGFRVADRRRGLGLRHALQALRALARFHAASHVLLEREPELLQRYDNTWRKPNNGSDVFIEGGIQAAADVCRTWPGFEKYADALLKYKRTVMRETTEFNDPKPNGFNVIIHGDFWVNNMMFRYEDGQPCEYRMVDLQISHVTSPALDILYFLYTSLSENVSAKYEDLLLREYHVALEETLTLLGMQAPSLQALLADVHAHGRFALFGAAWVLPLALASQAADLEASVGGDQAGVQHMYRSPRIRRWLQRLLPEFESRGWLPA